MRDLNAYRIPATLTPAATPTPIPIAKVSSEEDGEGAVLVSPRRTTESFRLYAINRPSTDVVPEKNLREVSIGKGDHVFRAYDT